MPINWNALLEQAIALGKDEAATFLSENRVYVELMPGMAIKTFISTLPGKRELTDEKMWGALLRNMSREARDEYNRMLIEDASQVGDYVAGLFAQTKMFKNALSSVSEAAKGVLNLVFSMLEEVLKSQGNGGGA